MKKNFKPYGTFIKVKSKNMCVSVTGKGERIILFLAGLNSACPIIEMKALSSYLEDKYTLVTIEYLGYGMSDNAAEERTVENIVDDIHEAMKILGYNRYSVAAHSISGLYCLLYTNLYSCELENFIGIDTSVPYQFDTDVYINKMLKKKMEQYEHCSWFTIERTRILSKSFLRHINDYNYSTNDLTAYSEMAVKSLNHGSVINEMQNAVDNFNKMKNYTFPADVNCLCLISSRSMRDFPNWLEWHKKVHNNACTIKINASHMLHIQKPKAIAEEIDDFLNVAGRLF